VVYLPIIRKRIRSYSIAVLDTCTGLYEVIEPACQSHYIVLLTNKLMWCSCR